MKSKVQLREWLESLASEADAQTRLYDSAISKLYHCLSSLYVWWRDADRYDGFLEELYAENDITTRRKNEENFVRVIRLVWRIDWAGNRGASLQSWSKALREIHHEYETNKEKYSVNAIENLVLFIRKSGGVSGLTKSKEDSEDATFDDEKIKKKKKTASRREIENQAKLRGKNKELAELYFENQAKTISTLDLQNIAVTTNDKNYAIALIRKKRDGYQVLSLTEQDDLITEAMVM